jgi:hypothetical protein
VYLNFGTKRFLRAKNKGKIIMRVIKALLALPLVVLLVQPAVAAKITPSHVYQVVDDVVAELVLLAGVNFSDVKIPSVPAIKGKKPRHVIQKGLEILRQVQTLKMINGLKVSDVVPAPVREITPADVKNSVTQVLLQIRELKPIFGVTQKPAPAQLKKAKAQAMSIIGLLRSGF